MPFKFLDASDKDEIVISWWVILPTILSLETTKCAFEPHLHIHATQSDQPLERPSSN